jgi:hypothetical protein
MNDINRVNRSRQRARIGEAKRQKVAHLLKRAARITAVP